MNYFWAFCVGGAICVAGQLLIDLTGLTPARILTVFIHSVLCCVCILTYLLCNCISTGGT